MNQITRPRKTLALAIGIAALPIAATATATASSRDPRVTVRGNGTITDEGWRYTLHGTATGRPFDGELFGTMRAQTGSWPEPGTCKSGNASIVIDGADRRELSFVTVGDVCRLSDDSAYVFIGQFDTTDSTPRRLNNIQGTIDIRVADDGAAIVTAIEF